MFDNNELRTDIVAAIRVFQPVSVRMKDTFSNTNDVVNNRDELYSLLSNECDMWFSAENKRFFADTFIEKYIQLIESSVIDDSDKSISFEMHDSHQYIITKL